MCLFWQRIIKQAITAETVMAFTLSFALSPLSLVTSLSCSYSADPSLGTFLPPTQCWTHVPHPRSLITFVNYYSYFVLRVVFAFSCTPPYFITHPCRRRPCIIPSKIINYCSSLLSSVRQSFFYLRFCALCFAHRSSSNLSCTPAALL